MDKADELAVEMFMRPSRDTRYGARIPVGPGITPYKYLLDQVLLCTNTCRTRYCLAIIPGVDVG